MCVCVCVCVCVWGVCVRVCVCVCVRVCGVCVVYMKACASCTGFCKMVIANIDSRLTFELQRYLQL